MRYFSGMTLAQARAIRPINTLYKGAIKNQDAGRALQLVALAQAKLGASTRSVLAFQGNAGWPLPVLQALSRCLYSAI